jgi:hypothetical protein
MLVCSQTLHDICNYSRNVESEVNREKSTF